VAKKFLLRLPTSNFRVSGFLTMFVRHLSAIANAENNHSLDVDDLVVAQAFVGKALVMKRFSPRARGRAGRIEKPFSHLTIIVRQVSEAA
jgi:ribosomal protein L22